MITQLLLCTALAAASPSEQAQGDLVAIDVLIEPGPRMLTEAAQWNARMREQSPSGFSLDAEHTPHITLVQAFVARQDVPKVLAAVDGVRSRLDLDFKPTATGLYHIPSGRIGLAGIVVAPSERLLALQQAVIDAVGRYTRKGGNPSAFVPDASGAPFDAMALPYVETFVQTQTGTHYNPHVTVGIAPLEWLERLEKQPFEKFDFDLKGLAVYQLGNYGTAARRLGPKD